MSVEENVKTGLLLTLYTLAFMVLFRWILDDALELIGGITIMYLLIPPVLALLLLNRIHNQRVFFWDYITLPVSLFGVYLFFAGVINSRILEELRIELPLLWRDGLWYFTTELMLVTLITMIAFVFISNKLYKIRMR